MKTILLIDTNYLCYRAWYSKGDLSYGDLHTGVVFGVLQDIVAFQDRFDPYAMCFCFDFGRPIREVHYPQYKSGRRDKQRSSDDIEAFQRAFNPQVKALRKEYLKQLGYSNIFYDKGYEADDCIAQLVLQYAERKVQLIIISADHDLYQLLGHRVSLFKPQHKQLITHDSFSREYGVTPLQWVDVKSIAGCSSDSIQGIKGVGEITACKFLNGKLDTKSKAFEKIVKGNKTWKANRYIVKLPFPGIREFTVKKDKTTAVSWNVLARKLGMKTMVGKR